MPQIRAIQLDHNTLQNYWKHIQNPQPALFRLCTRAVTPVLIDSLHHAHC